MMILKYALVGLVFLGGVNANAQDEARPVKTEKQANKKTVGERAAEKSEKMIELLSLDAEQAEKVRTLNLKVEHKIKAIKDNDQLDKAKKKEFIRGNKKDHKTIMVAILNADQLAIYEEYLATKKAENKEKRAEKVPVKEKVNATE